MKKTLISLLLFISITLYAFAQNTFHANKIISYTTSPKNISFYHKNPESIPYSNFKTLQAYLSSQKKHLKFAMNGGMYLRDLSPQGLYIENAKQIKDVDRTQDAYGNFYMQPNGIFYITKDKKAYVTPTKKFKYSDNINYATQSGPMLVIDSQIHHQFMPNSKNVHIRNGMGILPNGDLLFAISSHKINFYNFATFFKQHGCKNALYLDGFVSRIYLPSQGITHDDGLFGIIIGEEANK